MVFKNAKMSVLFLWLLVVPALPSSAGSSIQTPKFLFQGPPGAQILQPRSAGTAVDSEHGLALIAFSTPAPPLTL